MTVEELNRRTSLAWRVAKGETLNTQEKEELTTLNQKLASESRPPLKLSPETLKALETLEALTNE